MDNNNELKTENYYLAYLDILGTKDIVLKDKDDKYLHKLDKIYKKAINDKKFINEHNNKDIFAKIFSDNILLGIKLHKDEEFNKPKLEKLINLAGLIQLNTLKEGYLLRGAIVRGDFCDTGIFVHGKALIEAVTLEENVAIYPRIIIHRKNAFTTNPAYITRDSDDYYYVNSYFFSYEKNFGMFRKKLLANLKKEKNEKVKQKIMWFINYHNDYFINNPVDNIPDIIPEITLEDILDATK